MSPEGAEGADGPRSVARAALCSHRRAYGVAKRCLDLFVAVCLLLLLGPVMLATAFTVRVCMGSPVLFRQQRPGLARRPFSLLKFRTMTSARAPDGSLLPDGRRLTPLGVFLRRFSLDELPALLNVVSGDMSLVGPRPLLFKYLPYFTPREGRRFSVKPGLTGWAQVNGRNNTPWVARLEHDAWYVDNHCFWLDMRILLLTPARVLGGQDVVPNPRSVMLDLDEEREGVRVDTQAPEA